MKITIYVQHNHLENLYSLINNFDCGAIEWNTEKTGSYIMVTIDYNDFIKLTDR